tara:strand:- start:817 stop:2175 length:1359 start_codon:yes stop_codon:yes gene_type:complete
MFRIDNTTSAAAADAVPVAGLEQFFTEGNPAGAIPATDVPSWWLNMVQEELRNILIAAGINPDKADNTQVAAAIAQLIAALTLGGISDVTLSTPQTGEALIYNGAGWVNGTPASLLGEMRKVSLLNGLRDTISEGSAARLINSFPDPYTDLSGINAGASSNYQHNALNGYIENPGTIVTPSSAGAWNGATGSFTFAGDDLARTSGIVAVRTNDSFTGDFEINFIMTSFVGTAGFGIYEVAEDATFNSANQKAGMQSMTKSWFVGDDDVGEDIYYGAAKQLDAVIADGSVIKLERVAGTFSLWDDGVLVHTWSQTSTNEVRFACGSDTGLDFDNMSWTVPGVAGDMVITSAALPTLAVPTNGHFIGLVEAVDAIVLNTDLKLFMSRDAGTVWDELVLEQLDETVIDVNGTPTSVPVLFAEGALSGASESNGLYRWNSYNSKHVRLHGAAPEFS